MADENLNNESGNEPVNLPVKHEEDAGTFVDKGEFNKFREDTNSALTTIIGMLEKKDEKQVKEPAQGEVAKAVSDAQILVEAARGDTGYMPPQYQRIFEKYFDPTDGFEARLIFPEIDEEGRESGGIMFSIVVPDKFTNVTPAHKTFYKVDVRSRVLRPDGISRGIDDWCKRVARNLGYNKLLRTK